MFLSVIIPVYNVEKYIKHCIESCLNIEKYTSSFEIIIVNDGTPDNSMEIIEKIIPGHQNVRIINKSNGGLSSARNAGLKIAKGDYIWFVDSDDSIEPSLVAQMMRTITHHHNNIEILSFYTKILKENDSDFSQDAIRNIVSDTIISGKKLYFSDYKYPYSAVQFYWFKRQFLIENDLSFKEGVIFEDLLFTAQALSIAKNCIYLLSLGYYYLLRGGSITDQKTSVKRCMNLISVMDEMNLFQKKLSLKESKKVIYDSISRCYIALYKRNFMKLSKFDKMIIRENIICRYNKYINIAILRSCNIRYFIAYLIYRFLV